MRNILYIDGFNLFYRNFSTYNSINENGEPNGGFLGFMQQLRNQVDKFKPLMVYVVFDGSEAGYRRRQILKNYKGKKARKARFSYLTLGNDLVEEIDNQDEQIIQIFNFLKKLPISVIQVEYYEADDIIAYMVNENKHLGYNQIISSTDQDYLQEINDNIFVYNPIREILFDKKAVFEKYDILSENFIYARLVSGDNSDKVQGIDGIGFKTLIKLLPQLQSAKINSFDEFSKMILECETGKSKKTKLLKDNIELLFRNYKLCQLSIANISMKGITSIKSQKENESKKKVSFMDVRIYILKQNLAHQIKNFDNWIKPFYIPRNQLT